MDIATLNSLYDLFKKASSRPDWKSSLENLATELRPFVLFDNIAVYVTDRSTGALEIVYARALGRGKGAEADAAWGDSIAADVMASGRAVVQSPPIKPNTNTDRLDHSYMLGLPLQTGAQLIGAAVFVRFGGPEFFEEHHQVAALAASWIGNLFERQAWQETYRQLDEMQRRVRLQDDFLATISHELRTPLGFIKGYSTTLLRQDTSWDATTQREFLTIIEEEADRLALLIEDLLESARLQSNTLQLKFQPIRLDALLRDVVLRLKQRHPSLSVSLNFGVAPLIPGDNVHLTRVFDNLFSNALKYAPESPIEIALSSAREALHVEFRDHGPGIQPEHQAMIFERFYRVPGPHAASTGTGLGLYICKQIIASHRGKIWVDSAPGRGTTFHIELPLKAEPQPGM